MKTMYFCPDCGGSVKILAHDKKSEYKALVCEKCGLRTAFYEDLESAPIPNREWKHDVETCPFCGSDPQGCRHFYGFTVGCGNITCTCFPQTTSYPSLKKAVQYWNRRV